jgi:hypothetical protein
VHQIWSWDWKFGRRGCKLCIISQSM